MTKNQADKLMVERFEEIASRAAKAEDNSELIDLTDCMHKLYITLVNSGAFEGGTVVDTSSGLGS